MQAGAAVRRARAARHHHDARPAGELAVRLRHHRGPALLPAGDDFDLVANVVERVEQRQKALARHAENAVDTVSDERVGEMPRAGLLFRRGFRDHDAAYIAARTLTR